VKLVVQANPELYRPDDLGAHVPVLPTHWERDRFPPGTAILPVPVDRVRLPPRRNPGTPVATFLHVAAPAMLDRNGTDLVLAALPYVQAECRLLVHVPSGVPVPHVLRRQPRGLRVGNVEVMARAGVENYWDVWTEDVGALVLPRRYGGLSLTMQEAFSLALPVVTTDLDPQKGWMGTSLVPVKNPRPTPMKGGDFDVWTCDPHDLAIAMDRLATDADHAASLSERADRQGATLDWEHWAPLYRETLAAC
jgi:hypothetical protein